MGAVQIRSKLAWGLAAFALMVPSRADAADETRRDPQGDPLPPGALARLGTVRLRQNGPIVLAAFRAGGKQVLSVTENRGCVFWDAATAKEVRHFDTENDINGPVALSPDGKMLVYGEGGNLYFHDTATGQARPAQLIGERNLTHLRFSPDGKTLALGCNRPIPPNENDERGRPPSVILLWDLAAGKTRHTLKGHDRANIAHLAFSPDGKTLASNCRDDAKVQLWDVASGREKRAWSIPEKSVASLVFSPDGKTLTTSSHEGRQGRLRFWDAATGKQQREAARPAQPLELTYSPDGKKLFGVEAGRLRVYEAATAEDVRSFTPPARELGQFVLSPDGKTVAAWGLGAHALDLWDASTGQARHRFAGHRGPIAGLAFSADGSTVFSSAGHPFFATSNGAAFWGVASWHDKKAANVFQWDAASGQLRGRRGANCGAISCLSLSPDGKLLAMGGASDHHIHLWGTATRKEVGCLRGHKESPFGISWSADGKTLLANDVESIRVWEVASGRQRHVFAWQNSAEDRAALSPDGKQMVIATAGVMFLWDIAASKEVRRFAEPDRSFCFARLAAISPDGRTVAAAGYMGRMALWDMANGKILGEFERRPGSGGEHSQLLFTADGRGLLTGHFEGTVVLWEVATRKMRRRFGEPSSPVTALALAPDGRSFAAGRWDSTSLVWDMTERENDKKELDKVQLARLWKELADADAAKAYRAIWRLALAPRQALPFLRSRLKPAPTLDDAARKRVQDWLRELDSVDFAVRQKATHELEQLGEAPRPLLRSALTAKPSLEARRRIEQLLERLKPKSPESVRALRALEAIENMRTVEARQYLKALSQGAVDAMLTQAAKAAWKRCQPKP